MPRPTSLTPKVQADITDAIAAGNYYEAACQRAGIDYSNFRRWMKWGESKAKDRIIYYQFREAVLAAEGRAEGTVGLEKQGAERFGGGGEATSVCGVGGIVKAQIEHEVAGAVEVERSIEEESRPTGGKDLFVSLIGSCPACGLPSRLEVSGQRGVLEADGPIAEGLAWRGLDVEGKGSDAAGGTDFIGQIDGLDAGIVVEGPEGIVPSGTGAADGEGLAGGDGFQAG